MNSSRTTPVQLSGGAGFGLEDKIAARLFLSLLQSEPFFGTQYGSPVQVDFQVSESGWFLDDLLVTLADQSDGLSRVAISAKTAKQVTGTKGFHPSFVDAAWAQWIDATNGPFDPSRDLLCLATANIADSVFKAWNELLKEAIATTVDRFLARIQEASPIKKTLFNSLVADPDKFDGIDSHDAVTLMRQIRLLRFDFPAEPSGDEANAIGLCHRVLRIERPRTASELWSELVSTAKRLRESGGKMDVPHLVTTLQTARFELAQRPNYENDWVRLDELSMGLRSSIRSDIGNDISLIRSDLHRDIREHIASSDMLVVLGPSGVGKSAMLTQLATCADNVVWMNRGQFDMADATQQRVALDLDHELPEILLSSTYSLNILVIDALEGFSDQAIRLLASVISALAVDQFSNWKIVISCQVHMWNRVRRLLLAECQFHPTAYELRSIDTDDVARVFEACGIPGFSREPAALGLFTNLKVLDWVVRALRADATSLRPKTASTKNIVAAIWDFWVGGGQQQHATAKLLRQLAVKQTVTFATGLPFDELSGTSLQLLPSLESRDVLRTENDQVFFSHDLIADWIRLRELCKETVDPAALRQCAGNPVWHSAIRLYGQSLLDSDGLATNTWEVVQQNVRDGSADGDIAGDLLLDAVYFHPSAYSKLADLSELLLASDTDLFSRTTKRFLLVATAADPRISTLTTEQDMRLLLKSQMRLPLWRSWLPMLQFLRDNLAEYVERLPPSVAKICSLWLQWAPAKAADGTTFTMRTQAAEIAVNLARETQARNLEDTWFQGSDKVFYEAALFAAQDLPDEISELALELSNRRPIGATLKIRITQYKIKRRQEQQERKKQVGEERPRPIPSSLSSFRGERRDPWPIGPTEQVDDSFRSVAWKSNALQGLIIERPTAAAEVILALCVEAPGYDYDDDDYLGKSGIEHWNVEMPDSYFNGPFLLFLQNDSDTGLGLILDLVNFATDRWCDQFAKRHPDTKPPSMAVEFESEKRQWWGNWQLYGWFRGDAGTGCPVNCALMALEKWLYEQLDAGADVSDVLHAVLSRSRSVAFAGLLCVIGKKRPELFAGPLLPLLGEARIYEWDSALVLNSTLTGMDLFLWTRYGEAVFDAMKEWHSLKNRQYDLRTIAKLTLLANADAEAFFTERIQQWAQSGADNEHLCAQFDIRNYAEVTSEDGETAWEFSYPEALEKKVEVALGENQQAMLILNLPTQCENMVERGSVLEGARLQPFLEQLKSLAEESEALADQFTEQKKPAAVLAGIYLLLSQHRDWLESKPDAYSWCKNYLSKVFQHPPDPGENDSPYSISVTDWELFAGKSAILMLAANPNSKVWREAAAESVMAYRYSVTGAVLQTAYSRREELGADFYRLVNVGKLWSSVQSIFAREPDTQSLFRHRNRLKRAFVGRLITDALLPLTRLGAAGRRIIVRQRLREYQAFSFEDIEAAKQRIRSSHVSGLNWMLLQSSLSWLPERLSSNEGTERARFYDEYEDLLSYCLAQAPEDDDDSSGEKVPNDLIRWCLGRIVALAMDLDVAAGRTLWQPIMELGIGAPYWVRSFVTQWFLTGIKVANDPVHFSQRWMELIDYTLNSPIWQPQQYRDYRRSEILREVMGLRAGAAFIGPTEFKPIIENLAGRYETWAETWLSDVDAANEFASFLSRPSAAPLVPTSVKWLADHVAEYSDYGWREKGLKTNLATVLQRAWSEFGPEILEDDTQRNAFFDLLSALVQRQNDAAIILQGEVGAISAYDRDRK